MKTTTTIIMAILALVMLSGFAFATVDVNYATYEAKYDTNRNFITSTTPVDNVNVIGFVCADSSCSSVSSQLWNGQTLSTGNSNEIKLTYPTQLQSQYGYAIFYYKPGYVAWVQTPNWAGSGTVPGVESKYLTKIESCKSPVDTFAVINDVYPNQPVMVDISTSLDANTASPVMWNNLVGYHPAQLANYEKTQVTVTLVISNGAGQVVSTQEQVVSLDPSGSQRVMFDYTPTTIDRYTARVTTTVTDAKCLSTDAQFSQQSFNVIAQGPTNQCYTLIDNLNVQPSNQTVGQPVTISFDKISNAYDAQGQLSTLGTAANINVVQNGQTVSSQQLQIGANQNVVVPQIASVQFTPQSGGFYTVTVNGFSQNCPYTTSTADTASQSFYVNIPVVIDYNNTNTTPTNTTNTTTNQAPVWLTLPGVTLQQNSGLNLNVLNLNLYVIDPDSNALSFALVSSSNPAVATCSVNAQTGSVNCNAPVGGQVGTSTITISANDGTTTMTSSFVVTVQAVVNPNMSCTGPNGVIIANTASQTYFQSATVPFGSLCVSEARTCSNSVLSGTFTQPTCTVTPAINCVGPNGAAISHSASATYFQSATVPFGSACTSEVRTCNNGALSGSFAQVTCTVAPASSCVDPNGVVLANSVSSTYFQSATVPFGSVCASEVRTCNNGLLSGSFTQSACTVLPAGLACVGPDGSTIADGTSMTYYQFSNVVTGNVCTSEVRACNNGALSGSFQFNSCIVGANTPPAWSNNPQLTIRRNSGYGSIDLNQFVYDPEVPPQILTFSPALGEDISQLHDSIQGCSLDPSGILSCWTNHGQDGKAVVNVSVSDGINSTISEVTIIVGIDKVPSREKTNDGLRIMQFHVPDFSVGELTSGTVPISVGLKNEGKRLKDVIVTATILETGARVTANSFNIGSETRNVQLYVPLDVNMQPGVYTIRLSISDKESGLNRIEHRDLVVYPGR